MVDFRYHLVSIIAVFLALAVGIVVGTTALNAPIADGLRRNITALTSDKRQLEANVRQLRSTASSEEQFTDLMAGQLLRDRLLGRSVLVLSTPDAAASLRDATVKSLGLAGAQVAGELRLSPALLDPSSSQAVTAAVDSSAPTTLTLPQGSPVSRAAAELAAALAPGTNNPLTPAQSAAVVSQFQKANLLDVEGAAVQPTADLVLLLTGPAPATTSDEVAARNTSVLAVAGALDQRAGVVVAGPIGSADNGGVVDAVRDNGQLGSRVSSVDNADTAQGRVACMLALRQQHEGGTGRYGIGNRAQGPAPSPAP